MRFRLGMVIGFGAGYYLGAKAGRDRYEQLNQMLAKVRRSDAYETASHKAKDIVDLTVETAREFVEDHLPGHADLPSAGDRYDGDLSALGHTGAIG